MSDIWRRKKLNSLRNRETAFYNDIKNFKASSNLNFNCNHCPNGPIFIFGTGIIFAPISILIQFSNSPIFEFDLFSCDSGVYISSVYTLTSTLDI